jgi:hypothetical protein
LGAQTKEETMDNQLPPAEHPLLTPVEALRLEVDRTRIEVDRLRLQFDWTRVVLTVLAVIVPAITVFATLVFGIHSQERQAENELIRQSAELVMDTNSAGLIENRARVLKVLLGARLPADFAESFKSEDFFYVSDDEVKGALLNLLATHLDKRDQICAMYQELFPERKWVAAPDVCGAR